MPKGHLRYFCITLATAQTPLILQQAIKHVLHSDDNKSDRPIDITVRITQDTLSAQWNHVARGYKRFAADTDPFSIDVDWDTSKGPPLARKGCTFSRAGPLQHPHIPPPHDSSHCVGRYVSFQNQKKPAWVMYSDANDPSRWWVLPPNVSFDNDHWNNCRTPDHNLIVDGDHVYQLVLGD